MLQEAKLPTNTRVGELVDFVRAVYPDPLPRADVLATAGLTDLADRPVDRLSGGQAQRVRFALAFAGGPDLLVLDEPTAALDVEARREFWAAMRSYADRGHTVLFSTHYLEEADDNADHVVVIDGGRLRAYGTPEEIKQTVAGRTVAVDLDGRGAAGLETLPGVVAVTVRGDRAWLRSKDADATVVALVRERGGVTNLEVAGAGLEEAFLALTETPDLEGSPA
jgi:ABC-2 type transport system ATP-binding protein